MKTIKYNNKTYIIPKPFDQCFFGDEPTKMMTIGNRFNDESGPGQFAKLPAFAVAIYDTIIGCEATEDYTCLLYTSPSPRDRQKSRMPSSA